MRFRHSAGFGKRIEFWVIGQMLKEGIDVYIPLVDDNAIDAVVRRADGSFVEVQIKARSKDVIPGDAAVLCRRKSSKWHAHAQLGAARELQRWAALLWIRSS